MYAFALHTVVYAYKTKTKILHCIHKLKETESLNALSNVLP